MSHFSRCMRQEPWWLDLAWDALTEMASPDQCPGTTQSSSSLVFSFFGRSMIALQMLLVARLYTVCTMLFMPCVCILKSITPLLHKDKSRTTICAVLCCAVLCCAMLCCAVLCCAVLCGAVLKSFLPNSHRATPSGAKQLLPHPT